MPLPYLNPTKKAKERITNIPTIQNLSLLEYFSLYPNTNKINTKIILNIICSEVSINQMIDLEK